MKLSNFSAHGSVYAIRRCAGRGHIANFLLRDHAALKAALRYLKLLIEKALTISRDGFSTPPVVNHLLSIFKFATIRDVKRTCSMQFIPLL